MTSTRPAGNRRRFEGRTVIVTGAAGGLGQAIAGGFLAEGATVIGADRDGARLERARSSAPSGRFLPFVCDVTVKREVGALIEAGLKWRDQVDVLVNNAGVTSVGRVVDLTERQWDECLDVNAKAVLLCCQGVLPGMLARGRGAIVTVASQEGKRGTPYIAHYCAAKAAAINLTRAMALECAPRVRVNAVCPGVVDTAMVRSTLRELARIRGEDEASLRREWPTRIPMRRFQDAAQIAAGVLFLASDDAADITGEALNVSGGSVMD